MADWDPHGIQRRVVGWHHDRLDGLSDLKARARGASVLDLGCNRGRASLQMADYGARLIHGCDNYEPGIQACREFFADLRAVESRFEVCDLTVGAEALRVFGDQHYDITLMLATYHKIKRAMPDYRLSGLIKEVGKRTIKYFAWRGTADQHDANVQEIVTLDRELTEVGLRRTHTSYIATEIGVAAIWERVE